MAITDDHVFGWRMEDLLKPRIEEWLEEPIVKTAERFCEIDFCTNKSNHWVVEIKSRPRMRGGQYYQDSKSWDTWLVPTTKRKPDNYEDLIIMYFWEGDNSLWYWCWDDEAAKTFYQEPNYKGQMTYHVPAELFTRI